MNDLTPLPPLLTTASRRLSSGEGEQKCDSCFTPPLPRWSVSFRERGSGGEALFGIWRCLLLSLLLAGCALSAPPPDRGRAPLLTPLPPQVDAAFELPLRKPSVAKGAALYAEKCAACHGPTGRGDGEQAAQIQSSFGAAPADLTADGIARASTPAEWFDVITNGRLGRGMPPFNGSLSIDDRWDVIAYAWSLGSPDTTLATGGAIYAERCVQCHGETGKGDGPQADGSLPDLSNLSAYRDIAPGQWDDALGTAHVPSFSGKLSSAERSAVIDYVRSFTYDTAAVAEPPPAATPGPDSSPAPQPADGLTLSGSIINLTTGAAVPNAIEVTLYIFPGGAAEGVVTQTLKTDAAGRFNVSGLEAKAGDVVAATVTYADVTYPSPLVTLDGSTASIDLPIEVYEATRDTTAIQIDTLHIIIQQAGAAIGVNEIYVISNTGDRVVVNTEGPALRFGLPDAATAFRPLQGAAPDVVVESSDGFEYYDAVGVGSGALQLAIAYQMSLDTAGIVFDRALAYPATSVNVLVQTGGLNASTDQLTDRGLLDVDQQSYRQFSGGPLLSGQDLAFRLVQQGSLDVRLIAGIALLAVGVTAAGVGLRRRRKPDTNTKVHGVRSSERRGALKADPEQLMDEIAALDDAFEAGEIAEAQYRRQRGALKARLLRLMRGEGNHG